MKHLTYIFLLITLILTAPRKTLHPVFSGCFKWANAPVTRGSNITDEQDLSFKTLGVDFRYLKNNNYEMFRK